MLLWQLVSTVTDDEQPQSVLIRNKDPIWFKEQFETLLFQINSMFCFCNQSPIHDALGLNPLSRYPILNEHLHTHP